MGAGSSSKQQLGERALAAQKQTPSLRGSVVGDKQEVPEKVSQASDTDKEEEGSGDGRQTALGSFINRLTGGVPRQGTDKESAPIKAEEKTPEDPSQGKLNIDAPAGAPADEYEDELDIPAFLRRQAN